MQAEKDDPLLTFLQVCQVEPTPAEQSYFQLQLSDRRPRLLNEAERQLGKELRLVELEEAPKSITKRPFFFLRSWEHPVAVKATTQPSRGQPSRPPPSRQGAAATPPVGNPDQGR